MATVTVAPDPNAAPAYPIDAITQAIQEYHANRPSVPIAPQSTFLDRLAQGLQHVQAPGGSRGGDAFGANLVAGAVQGFAAPRVAAQKAAQDKLLADYEDQKTLQHDLLSAKLQGLMTQYTTAADIANFRRHEAAKERTHTVTAEEAKAFPRLRAWVGQPISQSKYEDVTTAAPEKSNQSTMYGNMDPAGTADGIFDGTLPPSGYGRFQAQINAELHKRHPHFNLQDATTNWEARRKLTATLNNPQFTQLNTASQSTFDMLDTVDSIARQLQEKLPVRSRTVPLNHLAQWVVDNGFAGDAETQNLVSRLNQTVGDAVLEGARVLNGGNAPYKEHLAQASRNLSPDWGLDRILTGTKQFRGNLLTRTNAIASSRPYSAPDVIGRGAAGGPEAQRELATPGAPVAAPGPTPGGWFDRNRPGGH